MFHDGHLFWVSDRGIAHCVDAKTGNLVYQERVTGITGSGGRAFYASIVKAGDNLLALNRSGATIVITPGSEYKQARVNQIVGDDSMFNATPALSDVQIVIRSDRFLYCIGKRTE